MSKKISYRKSAPGGSMRRLTTPSFARGGYEEGHPGSPRTLRRLTSTPLEKPRDLNPEDLSNMRDLRNLPASISDGGVD